MHERHQLERAPVRRFNDSAELTSCCPLEHVEAVENFGQVREGGGSRYWGSADEGFSLIGASTALLTGFSNIRSGVGTQRSKEREQGLPCSPYGNAPWLHCLHQSL